MTRLHFRLQVDHTSGDRREGHSRCKLVGDLEISDAVNHNVSGIGLLTTRFGIKARAVKNQAKGSIPGNVRRQLDKRLLVNFGG
jgi:hypothetical protein